MNATHKWTKDEIRALLMTKDAAVERALVVLFERQTTDEQAAAQTRHLNKRGFNATDAEFGTSLVRSIQKYGHLTPRQMTYARRMVRKYAGQIARVANERAASAVAAAQ